MDLGPKGKHPASGWMFEESQNKNTNKVERKQVLEEKNDRKVGINERMAEVGTTESSLFSWKGKTSMGCPGKQTALYCNHILIHNMLTR